MPQYRKVMKQKLQQIIQKAIRDTIFPGCVIGIVTRKGDKKILPYGRFTYDADSPEMKEDSVFDVASITKAIPTSSLALKALEMGRIRLDEVLVKWIPEYKSSYKDSVSIKHLLTHTLDYDFRLSACKDLPPKQILETIYNAELKAPPGSKFTYCNATSILLGILVERVFGEKLDVLAKEYFFNPLGMRQTSFSPGKTVIDKIVPTEIDTWRDRVIKGETHDESAWVLSRIMVPGSAGMFSTVPDLLVFLGMLLNNGVYKSQQYFKSDTITLLSTNQIGGIGESTGLGWEVNQHDYMGECCSQRTIGKTGFTGCVVMCDLEKGVGIAFLSNYTWPHRKKGKEQINAVRREVADVVFGKL